MKAEYIFIKYVEFYGMFKSINFCIFVRNIAYED